jgi:RNase P/RNase MRP subunit p29
VKLNLQTDILITEEQNKKKTSYGEKSDRFLIKGRRVLGRPKMRWKFKVKQEY